MKRWPLALLLLVFLSYVSAAELPLIYDGNGNLVSGDGLFRTYNSLNQLWKVYNGSSVNDLLLEEFTYHPTEERVLVKKLYWPNGTLRETTIYLSQSFVQVINSSGVHNFTYLFVDGMLVAQVNSDESKLFIHGNHEGSSSVVTNASGNVVETTTYTPFGEVLEGGTKTRYGYEGREHDTVVGDTDFDARKYKPEWALFTQPDNIVQNAFDPQALNRFSFERNNPLLLIDPDGHNYRVYYYPSEAKGIEFGHISVGVDSGFDGVEIRFENGGIGAEVTPSDDIRQGVSLVSFYPAETSYETRNYLDDDGNVILPDGYTDYIEFEQSRTADLKSIEEGMRLVQSTWWYNAGVHNSQHFAIKIINAGGEYRIQPTLLPSVTFQEMKNGKVVREVLKGGVNTRPLYTGWNGGAGRGSKGNGCVKGCGSSFGPRGGTGGTGSSGSSGSSGSGGRR